MSVKVNCPDDFRYERPKRHRGGQLPRGPRNGFIDDHGNEWVKGPNHHFKAEVDPATGAPYTYE